MIKKRRVEAVFSDQQDVTDRTRSGCWGSGVVTKEMYLQPSFLTSNDKPHHRVRCPIHGFIHFSRNEREIIDHCVFRRLRYIRQLALTEFIYPGATHTRFEHSLGVMEVATLSFDCLARKRGDLLEERFAQMPELEEQTMEKARQALRLAALLHDVGHACFSHAAEKNLFSGSDHEAFSREIIKNDGLLGEDLDRLFWNGCADLVAQILEGGKALAPQLLVLHDIVSGQMDADRADYLLRDSLHCGVDYGRFDLRRLVECLDLFEDEELGRLEIALHRDGIHSFEALILARYQMNTQVYYHRLRRIYDKYLTEYFSALKKDGEIPTTSEAILGENDVTMLARIFRDAGIDAGDRTKWARRIRDRKHHRMIYETGDDANYRDVEVLKGKVKEVGERFPDVNLIHDVVPVNIHKLATPRDTSAQGKVVMRLLGPNGTVEGDVGERSLVLKSIPPEFQCGRIYADVDPENKNLRKEMSSFARNEGRQ